MIPEREALNLRVMPEMKQQVEQYADAHGVPINAAAIMLLVAGLDKTKRQTARQAAAARATRIPEPFVVTPEMVTWAREHAPHVDGARETERFVDFWRAKTGQGATKRDWVATWRNWMRETEDRLALRNGNGAGRPALRRSTTDGAVDEVRAAMRDFLQSGGQLGLPGGQK